MSHLLGIDNDLDTNKQDKLFDLKLEENGRKVRSFYTGNKVPAKQVRILPARDDSMSVNDAAYPTSHIPYRYTGSDVPTWGDTGTPMFTHWVIKASGYKFLGNKGHNFLSPLNLKDPDGKRYPDPIQDMRRIAQTDPRWIRLTEDQVVNGRRESAALPKLKHFGYLNLLVFGTDDPAGYSVCVYRAPWVTIVDLFDQLCWRTTHGDTPVDPDWPRYLLGDVTSPKHGMCGVLRMGAARQSGFPQPEFSYTTVPQEPKWQYPGACSLDVNDPDRKPFAEYVLHQRYNLRDPENGALKFYTYADIVDALCADGAYPLDLIATACGDKCDLPDFVKKAATHSTPAPTPTAPPPSGQPAGPSAPPAAPGYAPQTGQPPAPAAPPAAPATPPPSGQPAAPSAPPAAPAATTPPAAPPPAGQAPAATPPPAAPPSAPPASPVQPSGQQAAPPAPPTAPPQNPGQPASPPAAPGISESATQPASAGVGTSDDPLASLNMSILSEEDQKRYRQLSERFMNKEVLPTEDLQWYLDTSNQLRK